MSRLASAVIMILGAIGRFIGILPQIPSLLLKYAVGILLHWCMEAEERVEGGANLVLTLVLAAPFAAIYAWVLLT